MLWSEVEKGLKRKGVTPGETWCDSSCSQTLGFSGAGSCRSLSGERWEPLSAAPSDTPETAARIRQRPLSCPVTSRSVTSVFLEKPSSSYFISIEKNKMSRAKSAKNLRYSLYYFLVALQGHHYYLLLMLILAVSRCLFWGCCCCHHNHHILRIANCW